MDALTLAVLAAVALVAGFVDSIAGGGGLLALPALLLAGLDPVSALATNKLQGSFGTASATQAYWRKGHIHLRNHMSAVISTFVAACCGVLAVNYAPTQLLNAGLPFLLIAIAIYFAISASLTNGPKHARMALPVFSLTVAPFIGFYDGFFGPGTGSFFMLAFVALLGFGIVQATAQTKLLNFTSNIAALLMFASTGKILWSVGLVMGAAQLIGAQLGAHFAMRQGAKIIRPLLVLVCIAMAIKLLSNPANPIRAFFP